MSNHFVYPQLFRYLLASISIRTFWNCMQGSGLCLYYLSIIEQTMKIKFLLWFALLYLANTACSSTCATCANSKSTYTSYTCYSCYENYFLYNNWCYSCSYCSSYKKCSSCPDTSSISSITIIVIIICSVVGFCLLVVVVKTLGNVCCVENDAGEIRLAGGVSAVNLVQQPLVVPAIQFKYNWILDSTKFLAAQNCSICLDSNVFLHTHCHHYFHPRCIWQWSTKKQGDCPLCKSKTLYPAKIYCQTCFEYYFEVNNKTLPVVIAQNKWKACDHCKQL